MLTIPSIDIRGGKVVRLLHGRFDAETAYGEDPAAQAEAFRAAGAEWVHVVDLDGARDGAVRQSKAIAAVARSTRVQAGGGVRSQRDVEALLGAGVGRVVLGSVAVQDPEATGAWLACFGGERIVVALDVLTETGEPMVLARGWQEAAGRSLWQALDALPPGMFRHLLVTDVGRDGAMAGPNLDLIRAIVARRPDLALQASGGVRGLGDLAQLRAAGAAAAIVGRALYEGALDLKEALGAR